MNRYLLPFIFLLLLSPLTAQIPQSFNYQAIIRDGTGAVLIDQPMDVLVEILDAPDGDLIYAERYDGVATDQYGLLNLLIGRGTNLGIPLSSVIWGEGSYFLELTMSFDDERIQIPATPLQSVPYALTAVTTVDPLWERGGGNSAALLVDRVGIGTTIPDEQLTIRHPTSAGMQLRSDEPGIAHIDLVSPHQNGNSTVRLSKEETMFRIRTTAGLPNDDAPLLFSMDGFGNLGLRVANPERKLDMWGPLDQYIRITGTTSSGIEFMQNGEDYRFTNEDGIFSLSRSLTPGNPETPIFLVEESGRFKMQQELNMDDRRIVNVADPEGPQQVVNRRYLEDFVAAQFAPRSLFPEGLSSEATNMTFDQCASRCRTLVEDGFSNWGVPNLDQLSQFADGAAGDLSFAWTTTETNANSASGYAADIGLGEKVIEPEGNSPIGRLTMQLTTGDVQHEVRNAQRSCRCVR